MIRDIKKVYLALAALGFILPYYFFIPFFTKNGFNIRLIISQLFANPISTFFELDLIITAIVFLLFSNWEAKRFEIAIWWGYLFATLLVGPSFSFPLFLYNRQVKVAGGKR